MIIVYTAITFAGSISINKINLINANGNDNNNNAIFSLRFNHHQCNNNIINSKIRYKNCDKDKDNEEKELSVNDKNNV